MDPLVIGSAGIGVLFLLLLIGMPIGYTLAFVGFGGISLIIDPAVALPTLVKSFYSTFTTYSFTVIPLFIIMGELATICGLSQGIFEVADKWLRRLPGGPPSGRIQSPGQRGGRHGASGGPASPGTVVPGASHPLPCAVDLCPRRPGSGVRP